MQNMKIWRNTLSFVLILLGSDGTRIKEFSDPDDDWTKVTGPPGAKIVHISFDGRTLAATDDKHRIWAKTGENGDWRSISGKLTQLTVLGSMIYGIGPDGRYLQGSTGEPFNGSWTCLAGINNANLTQVHFDGVTLAALNSTGGIHFSEVQLGFNNNSDWAQMDLNLTWLTFFEDVAYGVDNQGHIYIGSMHGEKYWKKLEGELTQIAYDGTKVVGVNSVNHKVWLAETHLNDISAEDWILLGRPMNQVDVFDNHVYGVHPDGSIYHLNLDTFKRTKYYGCPATF